MSAHSPESIPDSSAGEIYAVPPRASSDAQHAPENVRPRPRYLDPDWKNEGVPDTKFYKEYPADAWGEEASPNARVWKIYRDEMTHADAATIRSWNETLDVLLIFAGLFSAVSTAFIIESYKYIQPDYTQYMAQYLYTAASSSTTLTGAGVTLPFVGSLVPPDSFVRPSTTQRWTNGLWFTSLVVSLMVALLCILIKQWLSVYKERTTHSASSLRDWTRRHQLYYRGLDTWRLPALISLLPLLIHVALFLIFAGLVLFLRPLDDAIANALLAILAFMLLFYILCFIAPVWRVDCPSYMPLLKQALSVASYAIGFLLYLVRLPLFTESETNRLTKFRALAALKLERLVSRGKEHIVREVLAIREQNFELDGQALSTLLVSSNDTDVLDAAVEAIGAISAESTLQVVVRDAPQNIIDERTGRMSLCTGPTSSAFAILTDARRIRTSWQLSLIRGSTWPLFAPGMEQPMMDLYPTLGLDGLMIQFIALGWFTWDRPSLLRLAASLRVGLSDYVAGLLCAPGSLFLDHATCRLLLGVLNRCDDFGKDRNACVLLTLCAGDFAHAAFYEQILVLSSVCASLRGEPEEATPSRNDARVALEALDGLFATLATHDDYATDPQPTSLAIRHLGAMSRTICFSLPKTGRGWRFQWSHLTGLSEFLRSTPFAQLVSSVNFDGYLELLNMVDDESCRDPEQLQQYWTCAGILLRLSYTFDYPISYRDASMWQWGHFTLFSKLVRLLHDPRRRPVLLDRAHDATVRVIFHVLDAIGPRFGTGHVEDDPFILIASGLTLLLCRRQRLRLADADLVQRLFSPPFMTNQIRQLLTGDSNEGTEDRHRRVLELVRHCARLAPDAVERICDELETPGDGALVLGEEELVVVARVRRGLLPGGDLAAECDPSCICMCADRTDSFMTRLRKRALGLASSAFTSQV